MQRSGGVLMRLPWANRIYSIPLFEPDTIAGLTQIKGIEFQASDNCNHSS